MNTPIPPGDDVLVRAQPLADLIAEMIASAGSLPAEARQVADNLVLANLSGHDSHGVGMVPRYIAAIAEGGLVPNVQVQVLLDSGALLRLDGGLGYGQSVGAQAMRLGIERVRRHGVCIVALSRAHHLGRIGHWAEQCAQAQLVSVHFVNVLARPIVAPFGGRDARHGTNPFCVGVPYGQTAPIVLDFATSRIAQGKARVAFNRHEPLAPGCLLDEAGHPTTDARHAVIEPTGALLPFGEHKGSGLALVCELLGGALTGGQTWRGPADGRRQVVNGMLSILIDPAALGTAVHLAREVDAFVAWVKKSRAADGVDQVRVAGDTERESIARRRREGIPIDASTWAELGAAGERCGLAAQRFAQVR